jgi:beta-lactamase class D
LSNGWRIHGKTGTGAPMGADGKSDWAHAYGWFVGWAEKGRRSVVFVHQIQDDGEQEERAGLRARDEFMRALPGILEKV